MMGICSLSLLVLHETLLVHILYDNEKMLWKERSRIRAVQMDNLRGLLGIKRVERVPNAWIMELFGVMKGVNERVDEGVFWLFGHVERLEKDRIAKRVCRRECWYSCSLGRVWKRWIDTMKEFLREKGLDVRQARRMARVYEGECMGHSPGDEPQTLMRCHSCHNYMKPVCGNLSVAEPTT